jgi:3-hydroxy-3-methylglutaryl CoA synthase
MISDDYLFSDVGIDSIAFSAPKTYVDIEELALKRNVDPDKYKKGLLLREMRFPAPDEDIISIGLKAGYHALNKGDIDPMDIDAVFVGTETITYAVKSVSNIFAELLGISPNSMTQDIYNACAGGTLAILNAIALIEKGVINKALIISVDISSYEMQSPSEPTQGSGAIAMVLSKNPRIARFSKSFGKVSGNVNDFFRAANEKNAQAFGHYSVDTYLNFQLRAYDDLMDDIGDFHADFYTFHAPFAKLPLKCMRQIIQKRWINHISSLPRINSGRIKHSIIKKLDSFLHDVTVLPEYIFLKLKELGIPTSKFEDLSNWLIDNVKSKFLPQLRVPSHFGNMYNAAVWAQILYILENYARSNNTIYFGSYGSGATCISGLLKVEKHFKPLIRKKPRINDFIVHKEKTSIQEYELIKSGKIEPRVNILGRITEHEKNKSRGFTLHFCDEGCIIPNIRGLDRCPQGHSGYHERFFPLFAVLESEPVVNKDLHDLSYLSKGYVRVADNAEKGKPLEYEIRRIENGAEAEANCKVKGLLNWSPLYVPTSNIY